METDNDNRTTLGSWAGGDFATTVSQNRGVGVDADLPDENRFVAGVVQLLRRRSAELDRRGESDDVDIAIFILKPRPPDSIADAEREPMIDNGLTRVNGRLWFTAAPVISAHYVDLPDDSDDGRFSYVVDEHDVGSQPALIFDPRTVRPQLRWYPEGLDQPTNMELKPLEGSVNPGDVFSAINQVYNQCFITPGGLPQGVSLWEDPSHFAVLQNAEALVQSHLKAGLVMRFPFCTVRHEQTQVTGRTDLEIEQPDPLDRSQVTRYAIMELKVLRSFWSTGSTVSETHTKGWITDGVRQAAAYRTEKGFQWSALCCFDMRSDNMGDEASFGHVHEYADSLQVSLKRWFLYSSAAHLRQSMTSVINDCS